MQLDKDCVVCNSPDNTLLLDSVSGEKAGP